MSCGKRDLVGFGFGYEPVAGIGFVVEGEGELEYLLARGDERHLPKPRLLELGRGLGPVWGYDSVR